MTAQTPGRPVLPPKWSGKFRVLATVEAVQLTDDLRRGRKRAIPGDWIVRGVTGEFFPVEPDAFEAAYEPAPAAQDPQPAPGTVPAAALEALAARWEAEAAEACELPDGEFTRARRSQAFAFADCARSLRSLVTRTADGGAQC